MTPPPISTLFPKADFHSYGQNEGILTFENNSIHAPIIDGIVYYTELDIAYQSDEREFFESFKKNIAELRASYTEFIRNKISRNLIDAYSAFQPFNESSRSFYPFIHELKRKVLKPGDLILDTWCRTGWTGYFLAGLFPEQLVVSIWEGNKDVLGYAGFDYWMNDSARPENLSLIHLDINKPLPFAENTFKLVHGLDTLHRYDQIGLVPELLRVTKEEGVLIFPHIHLTNSIPDPFFERGEKQLHGTEWERYFDKQLANSNRKAFVLSEPGMFGLAQPQAIKTDPNTSDYNGLIALLPDKLSWELVPYKPELNPADRVIVNPYLKIDLNEATANIDPEYLNGVVGKMLERHPIYHDRVKPLSDYPLTPREVQLLYLAQHNFNLEEIAGQLNTSISSLTPEIEKLLHHEIIHVLPLSEVAINLQLFHAAIPFTKKEEQTFFHLRNQNGKTNENKAVIHVLEEEVELGREDIDYLITKIKARFLQLAIGRGDCVFLCSKPHFESILVLWAALEMGVEVHVLSTEIPTSTKVSLMKKHEAKGYFLDEQTFCTVSEQITQGVVIVMDDDNDQVPEGLYFSNWIEDAPETLPQKLDVPRPDDVAVTLFSSGTTGTPKGIRLTHGALFKSGKSFASSYEWTPEDKVMMITGLDSMSGLRNIAIASVCSSSTIVIPAFSESNATLSVIEGIATAEASVLTCTPALIKQFIHLGSRIKTDIKSLRQVLCTGGNLSTTLVHQFQELFDIRVLNYYGLTETCGLCIGETPQNADDVFMGSIGKPIEAIAQVVDENDQMVSKRQVGRLRIFSDRLMHGYLDQSLPSDLKIHDGWLYTGDLAIKDESGNFYLKGRERNIIKDVSGNIVYLSEVEDALLTHPEVRDVEVVKQAQDEIESLFATILLKKPELASDQYADKLKLFIRQTLGTNKVPNISFVNNIERDGRGNMKRD